MSGIDRAGAFQGAVRREVHGLFLYETRLASLSQAHTVLRAVDALKKHNVYLHCHALSSPGDVAEVARGDHEFVLTTVGKSKNSHPPLESVVGLDLPTFVFVRGAAASVGENTARLLATDGVDGVIRNTNLADRALHNSVSRDVKHRYHVKLLAEDEGRDLPTREDPVPESSLEKLLTGFTLATYPRTDLAAAARRGLRRRRRYDISFVGSTGHGTAEISRHRVRAAEEMSTLDVSGFKVHLATYQTSTTKTYDKKRFYEVMRRSKAVLSPWGYGEVCVRDFEAMMSGAVVIKPDMGHVVTNPTVYRPNETYLPCRRDFSDLAELVDRVSGHWKEFRGMRKRAYELIMESRSPRSIAALLASLILDGFSLTVPRETADRPAGFELPS